MDKNKDKIITKQIIAIIVAIPIASYCLLSILFMLYAFLNPFKSKSEFFNNLLGLPQKWSLENLKDAWEQGKFYLYYLNSIIVTVFSTISIVFFSCITAYGLARYKFKLSRFLYIVFTSGLMFPAVLLVVPLYLIARHLNLTDNLQGLVVVFSATSLAFGVFVLTGFFKTLSSEVHEAAKIDGAGEFKIFYGIMMPMAKPVIATLSTIISISVWNEYFVTLIFIQSSSKRTIPLALANFFAEFKSSWPMLFAALLITTLPIIIVYFIGSKQIIKGLTAGAIK